MEFAARAARPAPRLNCYWASRHDARIVRSPLPNPLRKGLLSNSLRKREKGQTRKAILNPRRGGKTNRSRIFFLQQRRGQSAGTSAANDVLRVRRESAGGRRGAGRRERAGRIDGHRRIHPVEKTAGARLIGATVNGTGSLLMRSRACRRRNAAGGRSYNMVSEAQRSRAPIQRLADVTAGYFVPVVIGVALATLAIWGIWGPEPRLAHAIVNAVAVLIIACPCALGLAYADVHHGRHGRGALAGVLIKMPRRWKPWRGEHAWVGQDPHLTEASRN